MSHILLAVRDSVRNLCLKNKGAVFSNLIDSDIAKDDLIRKIRHPVWPDGDTDKKPIVMTMPGLDNLLMMYYVVRDKVIKLWSFQQSNPFNSFF